MAYNLLRNQIIPTERFGIGKTLSLFSPCSTSTSLLQRACADDELAWERLFRLFAPTIYRSACQLGMTIEDAADIVQDVFAAVSRSLSGFDHSAPNSTFRGWLYVITLNKVRDRARRRSRRPETVPATDVSCNMDQVADIPDDVVNDPTDL